MAPEQEHSADISALITPDSPLYVPPSEIPSETSSETSSETTPETTPETVVTGYHGGSSAAPADHGNNIKIYDEVFESLLKTVRIASQKVLEMGMPPAKVEAAARTIAARRTDMVFAKAIELARKKVKSEAFTDAEILGEIAAASGIKLPVRTPPANTKKTSKKTPKKGATDE